MHISAEIVEGTDDSIPIDMGMERAHLLNDVTSVAGNHRRFGLDVVGSL